MKNKNDYKLEKVKSVLGFSFKILYDLLIILCILLIAIIVLQRLSNSNKTVNGIRIFKVVSGSMVPKYDIGEVVICKEVDVNSIKVGDAIVYKGKIGQLSNKIVMHEVVEINKSETGKLLIYAKGLNNADEDPAVTEDQIYGVVIFKSVILTWLYALATSIYSSFIIITILVLNVFISFNSDRFKRDSSKNKLGFVSSIEIPEETIEETQKETAEEINTDKEIEISDMQEENELEEIAEEENSVQNDTESVTNIEQKIQKKKDRKN